MKNTIRWIKKKFSWNLKYFQGKWKFMETENIRYESIYKLINVKDTKYAILDLGCGYGTLLNYFKKEDYSNYLGVDLSNYVISKAKKRNYLKSDFLSYNIQKFTPQTKFDVIIFNEVIYYLDNPLKELVRYSNYLNEGGFIIISIFGVREDLIEQFKGKLNLESHVTIKKDDRLIWGLSKFTKKI